MDESKKKELLLKLENSKKNYKNQLPNKILKIEQTWDLLINDPWDQDRFITFHRMVHTIAGSSGTFGLPAVGDVARQLEIIVKGQLELEEEPSVHIREKIHDELLNLSSITNKSIQTDTPPITVTNELEQQQLHHVNKDENNLIYFVEEDEELSLELATQISHYGYRVQTFNTLKQFFKAMKKDEPAIILMDVILSDGDGCEAVNEIQKDRATSIPTIFISEKSELTTRLNAAKAGGEEFFTKPLNVTDLVDKLDKFVQADDNEPFRILIVDDSVSMAQHFSLILQQTGMETAVVTDPLTVMEPLDNFRPDLILMDIYMPGCSGLELAKVIRQQEAFVSVPIVYLSGETDLKKQLAAMSLGGDDFLTKPIQPEHLVLSVTSRVKRSRILRNFMIRDGLTGLYNHTQTKEFLDMEIARAKRDNTQLAFAMVDMDKFKLVNDTYGHPTGDRVIKSLARLLKQRLRKSDIVGRYGGEEFAVILPNTNATTAEKILNEIRIAFGKISHKYKDILFNKTFSCGVAVYPGFADGTELNNAADNALYEAKEGGRNRVVFATETST
ncbi:MAG: diguanylate cyclase [Magnetococcales bacterium]|nr:diguanylate cyclase [Magnetococcales bacterium]